MQYIEFIDFLEMTRESFFIEVEGRPATINSFISDYNSKYSPPISMDTDGVCCLTDTVDKWGVELRIYLIVLMGCQDTGLVKRIQSRIIVQMNILIELIIISLLENFLTMDFI